MAYIKQLDAIRAFAIFTVIAAHWFPQGSILKEIGEMFDAPSIFFILSGFLITKILLADRTKAERLGYSRRIIFKNFFIKRILRIFPAYFLLIFLVYVIDTSKSIDYRYYLTFTSNFHIYEQQSWGPLTHLWSLAVEEQFYLGWPWIILLMKRKYLPYAIIFFILIGIISQRVLPENDFSQILTFTCFDTLGLGALLAWIVDKNPKSLPKVCSILSVSSILSFILILINFSVGKYYFLSNRTLMAIIMMWMLAYFLRQNRNATGGSLVFTNERLITIGKVSYGIYLYHNVLPYYTWNVFFRVNKYLPIPSGLIYNPYLLFIENLIVLVCITWLSWKFVEMPIQRLKKYFKNPGAKLPATVEIQYQTAKV